MKAKQNIFSRWHKIGSIVMVFLLAWLTVSTPFVFASVQHQQQIIKGNADGGSDYNPFSQTTEEKTETGINQLSEFLHDVALIDFHYISVPKFYKCQADDAYVAYHPDLLVPPPKA